MARFTVELVEVLIVKHAGNCAAIGRACGVTRPSDVKFIERHPRLAETLRDARETLVDEAESALGAAIVPAAERRAPALRRPGMLPSRR
jgi:hypothetical protein